jgi:hypothetical protein
MCSKPLHAEFHSPVVFLRLLLHESERLPFILVVVHVLGVGVLQNRIHDERAQPEEDEDEDEQREERFWNIQIVIVFQ